ncbi:unnamed protein product [Staurois parvus]|uniref:Uncharacterized protein n=1 Tax=Staurois parvus TaxID=386267 RepID=A0ABN9EN15_9NEOB|nr:unnamed protein product [Staurois parvus]
MLAALTAGNNYRIFRSIVQELTRDCGHSTGDDQRLDIVQELTRDCGHSTGDDQRLRT